MKIRMKMAIVCSVILIIVVSFFTYNLLQKASLKENVSYKYEIKIETIGSKEYTIFIPLPIEVRDNNIKISKMVQELKLINGEATFTIIETDKGKALNITFTGDTYIKASGTKKWEKWGNEEYDYDILSLQNITDQDDYYYHGHGNIPYWVWCKGLKNNETISIKIEAYFGNVHDETKSIAIDELTKNDWQIIYGSQEHVVE